MKQITVTLMLMAMGIQMSAAELDKNRLMTMKHRLDDVMEITDTALLKQKLVQVEEEFKTDSSEINKVRLGIIYHETALNLTFFSQEYKGYSQKSYDIMTELECSTTTKELLPFVSSYRGSALSLVSAETRKLGLLGKAFSLLNAAVAKYATVSYLPEFLRGSVSENMPWLFFGKRKYAKTDFQSIIRKYEQDNEYADWKIMSFTYWVWANQHRGTKYRSKALEYLDCAIALDPNYQAGRKKAEELRAKLIRQIQLIVVYLH